MAAPTPAASASGGLTEGAVARREDFMLDSLVCAVEVLFFIYYSYQVRHRTVRGKSNIVFFQTLCYATPSGFSVRLKRHFSLIGAKGLVCIADEMLCEQIVSHGTLNGGTVFDRPSTPLTPLPPRPPPCALPPLPPCPRRYPSGTENTQIKPAEAMQLVNLLETAGRELLALQKIVGDNNPLKLAGKSLQNGFRAGAGAGPFGSFGGGAAAAAAASAAAAAAGGGGGVGGGAQRQRDVVRLCAVMEITSVLLCTLSVALSQVLILLMHMYGAVHISINGVAVSVYVTLSVDVQSGIFFYCRWCLPLYMGGLVSVLCFFCPRAKGKSMLWFSSICIAPGCAFSRCVCHNELRWGGVVVSKTLIYCCCLSGTIIYACGFSLPWFVRVFTHGASFVDHGLRRQWAGR